MKKEVLEKLLILITTAFGLVAALAWNDTIKAIFRHFFGTSDTIAVMLLYAIMVSIIAVLVVIQLGKIAERKK
jgi:uncharacterized membrane protein YidH (DUF202 family)